MQLLYDKNFLKEENDEYKRVLEIFKKHFIIKLKEDTELDGNVWARFVDIQAKEDEGEWDCSAIANLVDYKEEFDLLKRWLG